VIPLAHAQFFPADGGGSNSSSFTAGPGGGRYVLRRAGSGFSHGGGGDGSGSSASWARTVLAMGQNVTESMGRAAGLALQTGGGVGGSGGHGRGPRSGGGSGGSSGRSGGGGRQGGANLDDACSGVAAVAGRGASVAGSVEPGSSLSSWRGMRSGATWAFGGGECRYRILGGCAGGASASAAADVVAVTAAAAVAAVCRLLVCFMS